MKFGLRAHDFMIEDDLDLLAKELRINNIQYIQFANGISLPKETKKGTEISKKLGIKVQKILSENKISIAILSCYVNLIGPDERTEEKNIIQFKRYLSLAESYGAKLVATEPGSLDPNFNQTYLNYENQVVDQAIDDVKKLVVEGEKVDTLVGIEAGINHPIHSLDTIEKMLNKINSSNLKIIFDPVNLLNSTNKDEVYEILEKGLKQFRNDIYAIHLKDFTFNGIKEIVTPGQGDMNFTKVFQIINDQMPDAMVILDEAPRDKLEVGIKLLKEKIKLIN